MFKAVLLHWLGAFKCLILTTNERVGWSCKIVLQTDTQTDTDFYSLRINIQIMEPFCPNPLPYLSRKKGPTFSEGKPLPGRIPLWVVFNAEFFSPFRGSLGNWLHFGSL